MLFDWAESTPVPAAPRQPDTPGYFEGIARGAGYVPVFSDGKNWFTKGLSDAGNWIADEIAKSLRDLAHQPFVAGTNIPLGLSGVNLALGGFHSQAGSLAFLAVSLGLATIAHRTRFFSTTAAPEETAGFDNPAAPYLAPLMALVAASMLTGAFTAGFDYGYPLRVLAVAGALWVFRHQYRDLRWTWSWTAVAIGG